MSNIPSATTKPVALRLPNEVLAILERRVGRGNKWDKVSDYIRDKITTDALRRR